MCSPCNQQQQHSSKQQKRIVDVDIYQSDEYVEQQDVNDEENGGDEGAGHRRMSMGEKVLSDVILLVLL
jgi:hypothetical protein